MISIYITIIFGFMIKSHISLYSRQSQTAAFFIPIVSLVLQNK
jgi:hypothetical protein